MGCNEESERAIFREFARARPLCIVRKSIESRKPPEPDILCSLRSGERIAFELVEILDKDLAVAIGASIELPRILKSRCPPLPGLDCGALVGVIFSNRLSQRQKINLFQILFEQLKLVPEKFAGKWPLPLDIRRKGLRGVTIDRGSVNDLQFNVSPATAIGDPTIEQLRKKFSKNYESTYPVELLLYYSFQPCFVGKEFGPDIAKAVADGIQPSPFRRVWVYDRRSKHVWSYPDRRRVSWSPRGVFRWLINWLTRVRDT